MKCLYGISLHVWYKMSSQAPLSGKIETVYPRPTLWGFLRSFIKKIILKENEKSLRNEGEGACGRKIEKCSRNKGEGILGRRIWENVTSFSTHFTNRDPLYSMLTPRFSFSVRKVWNYVNSDYHWRTRILLNLKTAMVASLLLKHGGVYQTTSCHASAECYWTRQLSPYLAVVAKTLVAKTLSKRNTWNLMSITDLQKKNILRYSAFCRGSDIGFFRCRDEG